MIRLLARRGQGELMFLEILHLDGCRRLLRDEAWRSKRLGHVRGHESRRGEGRGLHGESVWWSTPIWRWRGGGGMTETNKSGAQSDVERVFLMPADGGGRGQRVSFMSALNRVGKGSASPKQA